MINARSETAASKTAFRDALKSSRCLIPADGFYEWSRAGKTKQPYCFEVNEGELFAFAGLWDRWKDPNGQWVKSCSILTTTPNTVTAAVHDRMPAILDPDSYDLWLDGRQLLPYRDYGRVARHSGSMGSTVLTSIPSVVGRLSTSRETEATSF